MSSLEKGREEGGRETGDIVGKNFALGKVVNCIPDNHEQFCN